MKKLLALLLTLLLAVPALAETVEATETQLLTSPDGSYTIEVPEDYFPVNPKAIIALSQNETVAQYVMQSLGLENMEQMEAAIAEIDASNMIYVLGPNLWGVDFVSNLNVQFAPTSLTMEMLVILKDLLDAQFVQQYGSMGVPESALQFMDILQIGARQWYGVGFEFGGLTMLQLMTVENGRQYVFTFANLDLDTILPIVESFTIIAE